MVDKIIITARMAPWSWGTNTAFMEEIYITRYAGAYSAVT